MNGMMKFKRALLATVVACVATTTVTAATTDPTGAGTAFLNYQPGLALTQQFDLNGIYPGRTDPGEIGGGTVNFDFGMVRTLAAAFNPGGMAADGRTLMISQHPNVFSVIGLNFGGNGVNGFNVPNLAGAAIVGATAGTQLAVSGYNTGAATGAPTTSLTVDQIPAHSHPLAGGGMTGSTGGGMAFSHEQPSLAMTYLIAANGIYPSGSNAVQIGQVAAFGGSYLPVGWLPADGSVVRVDDYQVLFSLIGNKYGGDGITTFALPDLRGRTIVGAGAGPGLTPVSLGETFGDPMTTLTTAQLPGHDHGLPGGGVTGMTGGGAPVGLSQASIGLNYLIALDGAFPTRDFGLDGETPYMSEVVATTIDFAPRGWAFADGSLLSISQHSALFSLLGTYYGGDGVRTFALPDLRGRDIIGTGINGFSAGDRVGAENIMLLAGNLPAHDHSLPMGGVPEPASWAMLIAGFGLVGAMQRRRSAAPSSVAA